MQHINFFKDINKNNVNQAGGKGASLGEMTGAGIPVPPGFVVLASAFDRFLEETNLNSEIAARLKEVDPNDTNSVDKASNVIRDVIHDHAMPKDLADEILESFDQLDAEYVAVRSSATAEDGAVASWAGELETYLNTSSENVIEKVKSCWSSLFTPRAIFYRHEQKLIDHYVSVAVVVQKMIQSEISGIAFTVHPVTEDYNQMIIEAGYGLGEAIVSGQITPDSYVVSKSDMSIMDINVGVQTRKLIKSKVHKVLKSIKSNTDENVDFANEWVELGDEGEKQKLSGKQIVELAGLCKKIEEHYGFPCDIEWAFAEGKFYITQSRPITTLKKK
ncbi:MAG: PEP/pyruvate-binding domain-containing protein [Candidatus Magasanikiibacteriota bacterium]